MKLDKIVVESHGKMYVCRAKVDRKTNSVIAVSDDGSVIVTVRKLTPAETEILDTLSDTAASLRRRQRLPHNIVKSLRAGGLIAAVERSVCASGILQCHNGFYEDGLEPGAFERIVMRHPHEFGDHARQSATLYFAQEPFPLEQPQEAHDQPLQASA